MLLVIKTTAALTRRLEKRLEALHPYDVPEFLVLPVAGGNERYIEWVRRGVGE